MAIVKNPSAIGQAINLAAADARAENRLDDVNYIYKRYLIWTDICNAIQSVDLEMIEEVINNRDFSDVRKRLQEALK